MTAGAEARPPERLQRSSSARLLALPFQSSASANASFFSVMFGQIAASS